MQDQKIAGVLVEAETSGAGAGFDFLVCGIGVNVNHGRDDFPAELQGRATSLKLQTGHEVSRLDALADPDSSNASPLAASPPGRT